MENFQWIDWLITALVLFSAIVGALRGFVHGAILLLSWLGGAFLGVEYADSFASSLRFASSSAQMQSVLAFILILLCVVISGHFVSRVLSSILSKVGLGGLNVLLGLAFGIARGVLTVAVLLLLLGASNTMTETTTWKHSVMRPHWDPVVITLQEWLKLNLEKNSTIKDNQKKLTDGINDIHGQMTATSK